MIGGGGMIDRMVVSRRSLWEGMGSNCFSGERISALKMLTVLEVDGGDGCAITWIYLMPLN